MLMILCRSRASDPLWTGPMGFPPRKEYPGIPVVKSGLKKFSDFVSVDSPVSPMKRSPKYSER